MIRNLASEQWLMRERHTLLRQNHKLTEADLVNAMRRREALNPYKPDAKPPLKRYIPPPPRDNTKPVDLHGETLELSVVRISGVYMLLEKRHCYIGQSTNVYYRIGSHLGDYQHLAGLQLTAPHCFLLARVQDVEETRRNAEDRFIGAAAALGLTLGNRLTSVAIDKLMSLPNLEPEKERIQAVLQKAVTRE